MFTDIKVHLLLLILNLKKLSKADELVFFERIASNCLYSQNCVEKR